MEKLKEHHTTLLVGIYRNTKEKAACEESLNELERLADTYGLKTLAKIACPIKKITPATFIGTGKVKEILAVAEDQNIDLVIFDDEITPYQQRNLEKALKRSVIDRTELIIEVFAQRAQSKEARLQIELAKVKYEMPRLKRLWTHLSRQVSGGAGYLKGEGEKQIELDRRLLRHRLVRLEKEIKEVRAQ
ncbi:MAG TPA: GTPase HflX, partial [Rhabdochlamydiaceae bacterium]|nr:GTPase HflX [Rhabdochlamydiaceae bacterium]